MKNVVIKSPNGIRIIITHNANPELVKLFDEAIRNIKAQARINKDFVG